MNDSIPSGEHEDPKSDDLTDSDAPVQSDEEVLVCPHCLRPIDPNARLCIHCGAPVSAIGWGGGYAWRQAMGHRARPNRVVLIGVWLIFGPIALSCTIFLPIMVKRFLEWLAGNSYSIDPETDGLAYYVWTIAGLSLLLSLFGAILLRVTQNYLGAAEFKEPDEEESGDSTDTTSEL